MPMRLLAIAAGLAVPFALAAPALAQQATGPIPARGAACLSCHSASGRPVLPEVPIIAGQQPAYLARALESYRDGLRTGGPALVMASIAADLSDEDIKTLATWFGGLR